MKAPFPWFGGKSRIAPVVWQALGDVPGFIEPFCGSGAVLLNRPAPEAGSRRVETINDMDGLVCNFWRAVKDDPAEVAHYADWPVVENDLHARHMWLVERKDTLQERLEGDPDFYDAKAAGWWVWGMACWIGSEFCSGKGPWKIVRKDSVRQLVHLGDAGRGVSRQLVHLGNAGRGVSRQRVNLGDAGMGVNRALVHLSDAGMGDPGNGECGLRAWMAALAHRFNRVRVCCGDWRRICGGRSGDALQHFFACGEPCGVFLDPPYSAEAGRAETIYRRESLTVAHDVREWAVRHGNDRRLRIVLCGYNGEHKMPRGWRELAWKASSGYSMTGNGVGKNNRHRERIWLSPHCLPVSGARAVGRRR